PSSSARSKARRWSRAIFSSRPAVIATISRPSRRGSTGSSGRLTGWKKRSTAWTEKSMAWSTICPPLSAKRCATFCASATAAPRCSRQLNAFPAAARPLRSMAPLLHPDGLSRCPWVGPDPLYVAYHDEEWGIPEFDDRGLYEKLVLDGFQAGLSWITILRKRENFRRAFDRFEPDKIARYDKRKIEALMRDSGIVRNRMKIEGAVLSARAYLAVMENGPGFSRLLWDFL